MQSFFVIVFVISLIALVYFSLRFTISLLCKQDTSGYKKKLIASSVIFAVSLIVIGTIPKSSEQLAAKREKFGIEQPKEDGTIYEQRNDKIKTKEQKIDKPKELTPEEKAAKEAEQKAAEEKRLAEEAAAAEKKAQEEARKQAERQAEEERRASLLEYGVQLDYTIEKIAEHKYKVVGTTNLPNGTELSIDLGNYWIYRREVMGIPDEENGPTDLLEQQYLRENTFSGQSNQKVNNGKFEATFSNPKKLNPGRYELSIISVIASLQSKEVKEIFGEHGKNLFGEYVVDGGVFKEFLSGEKAVYLLSEVYLP